MLPEIVKVLQIMIGQRADLHGNLKVFHGHHNLRMKGQIHGVSDPFAAQQKGIYEIRIRP